MLNVALTVSYTPASLYLGGISDVPLGAQVAILPSGPTNTARRLPWLVWMMFASRRISALGLVACRFKRFSFIGFPFN